MLGKTLLEYLIERLRRVRNAQTLVIATTTNPTDDPVVDLCRRLGVECTRGSEQDVLGRHFEAATRFQAETVVRVTSDCPLIDPAVIDGAIDYYARHFPRYAYVANGASKTYPHGMDVEVFSYGALKAAHAESVKAYDREHVTQYITDHDDRFPCAQLSYGRNEGRHRWTVDTPDDFTLIEKILTAIYPENPRFTLEDALALLDRHPEWRAINTGPKHP